MWFQVAVAKHGANRVHAPKAHLQQIILFIYINGKYVNLNFKVIQLFVYNNRNIQ